LVPVDFLIHFPLTSTRRSTVSLAGIRATTRKASVFSYGPGPRPTRGRGSPAGLAGYTAADGMGSRVKSPRTGVSSGFTAEVGVLFPPELGTSRLESSYFSLGFYVVRSRTGEASAGPRDSLFPPTLLCALSRLLSFLSLPTHSPSSPSMLFSVLDRSIHSLRRSRARPSTARTPALGTRPEDASAARARSRGAQHFRLPCQSFSVRRVDPRRRA